jgi:cysteine-rich repeat protein
VPRRRRAQTATEVFADDAGFLSLAPDGGFKVYEQRPAIKECPLADEHRYKRDEDFIDELQLFLNGGVAPHCGELFDALCAAFGAGAPPVDLPTADCCALSSLPHSWTFSNPLLFQCQCGSGYRKGSEQCDDGELVGGGGPGDNDGCNKFCEVERGVPCRSSASFTCLRSQLCELHMPSQNQQNSHTRCLAGRDVLWVVLHAVPRQPRRLARPGPVLLLLRLRTKVHVRTPPLPPAPLPPRGAAEQSLPRSPAGARTRRSAPTAT